MCVILHEVILQVVGTFSYLKDGPGSLGGSVIKNPPANVEATGDMGSILGWGRSPGGGNGNQL